jgi:hypothetical protein
MPANAGIPDVTRQEKQASGSFLKKRTNKLLLTGAVCLARLQRHRHGRESGGTALGHPRLKTLSAILFLAVSAPALAQTTPNASNDCGIITLPKHPGDAPGGNIFTPALAGPQPADLPNDQTATYPDITPVTPDPITPTQITPDLAPNQPFPFSHIIADPVLAHGFGPETAAPPPKKAC